MKIISTLLVLMVSLVYLSAQTNEQPSGFLSYSNGTLVASSPDQVANALGVPSLVLSLVPVKYLPLLVVVLWLLPYGLRAYHAYQSGAGIKGTISAVAMGTNVPAPPTTTPSPAPPKV